MPDILAEFQFSENELHVWIVPTQTSEPVFSDIARVLSQEESARASRIPAPDKRRSFALTRSVLRILLGRYIGCDPAEIQLTTGPQGKPALAGHERIGFNLTRSGDFAAFAFSPSSPVGIDMEQVRAFPNLMNVIRRVLCPDETAELMTLPKSDLDAAFFRAWTRKEAYSKAVGLGLLMAFESFRVSVLPGRPAQLLHTGTDTSAAANWSMCDLPVSLGYAAALAYPGPVCRVAIRRVENLDGIIQGQGQFTSEILT